MTSPSRTTLDPTLLQDAFRALPSGMTLVDLEGRYLHASPAFCRMVGYEETELQGLSTQAITHPEDWPRQLRFIIELKAGTRPQFQMEKRFIRKDGQEIWAWLHAALLRDAEGRPTCMAAYVQDISDRIAAEQALARSLDRLAGILTTMEDGVVEVDLEGRITYANEAAERILHLPVESLTTRRFAHPDLQLADWDGRPLPAEGHPIARALATRQVVRGLRVGLSLEDGHQAWLITNAAPLFDGSDRIRGALVTFLDITETRRSEQALQQSQRLETLGLLAGSIAHDYNNLLGAMMVSLELARSEATAGQARHLQRAEGLAHKSADLTRQLLAYAGRGRGRKEDLDLNLLVQDMSELLQVSIAKRAPLELDLAPGELGLHGDRAQLQQVVLNLLTNAADAMTGRSGSIRLATSRGHFGPGEVPPELASEGFPEGPFVGLEVSDAGVGIPPETLQRIFEPFFTTKPTGQGLGLAAMLGIVRAHGGHVEVRSRVGEGTTFRLRFPALELGGVGPASPEAQEPYAGKGLVLVVDDEAAIRTVAAEILATVGFEVLVAGDGLEAVELLQAHGDRVRLVLLDLTMPRLDGFEALQRMKALRPEVRVLLSSGFAEPGMERRIPPGSVAGFLPKPYRVQDLIAAVKASLEA